MSFMNILFVELFFLDNDIPSNPSQELLSPLREPRIGVAARVMDPLTLSVGWEAVIGSRQEAPPHLWLPA